MKRPIFVFLRLVILVTTIGNTIIHLSQRSGEFDRNWDINTILFGLILLPIVFSITIAMMGFCLSIASTPIYAPSWYRNPISLKQIPQMYHMGAWVAFVGGLTLFSCRYVLQTQYNGLGYLEIIAGLSTLLGLQMAKILYKKKIKE